MSIYLKLLFGGLKSTTLLVLLAIIVGCTPNLTIDKREVLKSKVNYINKNPRKDALIVGVGNYKNRIRPLDGVKKDLKNIKRVLKYLNIQNIITLQDNQASLSDVRRAFNDYIHSDKNRKGNIISLLLLWSWCTGN